MCDALDSCSMPISPPPMAAMPSHRFIAQLADRMDDTDTSKRKKKKRNENITTSDSRKRRRFRRDSITKALKCFLLLVLFPIQLSGLPLSIICAAVRLLHSSPKTSFFALTHFVLEVIFCLSVCECWGFRVKKPPITYRNRS